MLKRKQKMTFDLYMNDYLNGFDNNQIVEAMRYSLLDGKHFRPNLIFALVKAFNIEESQAYPAALALEMVHTYSLIHDDLPCMDDDDYRRGKPSSHIAFGEAIATLTGDSLLTHAFGVIADSDYSNDIKVKMISYLSSLAGLKGMIYGQLLDLENEDLDVDQTTLDLIQDYKTGALFKTALYFGMLIGNDEANIDFYSELAIKIGRLFQIQDDLFEVIKSEKELGKSQSDLKNHKATTLTLHSVDEIRRYLTMEFNLVYDLINRRSDIDNRYLLDIIRRMETR